MERLNGLHFAKRVPSIVVTVPTLSKSYVAVRIDWIWSHIDRYPLNLPEFYIGDVANYLCSIKTAPM